MTKDPSILLAAPPAVVAVTDKIGEATTWFTLSNSVKVGTLIYLAIVGGYTLWKWYRQWQQARRSEKVQYDTDMGQL